MSRTLLFVVNVDWFFLSHRLPIAQEALRQGYKVHVATAITSGLEELNSYGLTIHPLNLKRSGYSLRNIWQTGLQLMQIFLKVRPDIVHLVTIKPSLIGGLVARLVKIPAVVVAVSGLGFVFTSTGIVATIRRWLAGILYRLVLRHENLKVIFQNADDRNCLVELTNLRMSKVEMIYGSGVDLSLFSHTPLPKGIPVVILASRLLIDKGVREFVAAARILKSRHISVRFCLVGATDPGNPNSLTDAELKDWEKEGVIELWGFRAEMPLVLAEANIVVLPSYYGEGLPKVLIEAAACGRPIVTTDHPGCRDSIVPGVTGILVPIQDAKALANVLQELIGDSDRCQNMGNAGRILAERDFDVRQVVKKHMRIYLQLMDKR